MELLYITSLCILGVMAVIGFYKGCEEVKGFVSFLFVILITAFLFGVPILTLILLYK